MGVRCSSCQKGFQHPEAHSVYLKPDAEMLFEEVAMDLAITCSTCLEVGSWLCDVAQREMLSSESREYIAVLQKVLDLMVNAISKSSRAAAFVAVVPDAALASMEVRKQSSGCLAAPGLSLTVYDEGFKEQFTEAVERLKHYTTARKCPVGGGFAVSSTSGRVLAASVTFVRGARAVGSSELAERLGQGVIFTRSTSEGVMVFPGTEVRRGRAWAVHQDLVEGHFVESQAVGMGLHDGLRAISQPSMTQPVVFAGAWSKDAGDLCQAHAVLRENEAALFEMKQAGGHDDMSVCSITEACGCAQRRLFNWQQAKVYHERTLAICNVHCAATALSAAQAWSNLGLAQLELKPAEAHRAFLNSLELFEVRCGTRSLLAGREACHCGMVMQLLGQPAKAVQTFQAALDIAKRWLKPDDVQMSVLMDNLGVALRDSGELERAKQLHEQALSIAEMALGQLDAQLARTLSNLAAVELELNMAEHARGLLERALLLTQTYWGKRHTFSLAVLLDMAICLALLGMMEQARGCLDQYRAASPATPHMPSAGTQLKLKEAAVEYAVSLGPAGAAEDSTTAGEAAGKLWVEAAHDIEDYLGEAAACRVCVLTIRSLRRSWDCAKRPAMSQWLSALAPTRPEFEGMRFVAAPRNVGDEIPQEFDDRDADNRPMVVEEINPRGS